jgi:hypothetical protein
MRLTVTQVPQHIAAIIGLTSVFVGCCQTDATNTAERSSHVLEVDASPASDPQVAADERGISEGQAVDIVREEYQQAIGQGLALRFTVNKEEEGFSVFVEWGSGYDRNGNLITHVGAHALYEVSSSGRITNVIGGL